MIVAVLRGAQQVNEGAVHHLKHRWVIIKVPGGKAGSSVTSASGNRRRGVLHGLLPGPLITVQLSVVGTTY